MPRQNPKILVFAGSTRGGSFNAQLAALVTKKLALRDVDVTQISLADYEMPLYNGDLEQESGPPEAAVKLHKLFASHQGIFIASPEYNASITPLLKNTIDWVSRVKPAPGAGSAFKKRVFAIGAASNGYYGGMRSLLQIRHVLEIGLGATVIPEQISVPGAATAFTDLGDLEAERSRAMLDAMLTRFIEEAERYVRA